MSRPELTHDSLKTLRALAVAVVEARRATRANAARGQEVVVGLDGEQSLLHVLNVHLKRNVSVP